MPITLKVGVLWDATLRRLNLVDDYMSGSTDIVVYVPVCTVLHCRGR